MNKNRLMPDWKISAVALSIAGIASGSELWITMTGLFWSSITFALILRHFNVSNRYGQQKQILKRIVIGYHAFLLMFVARPALAQEAGSTCTNTGLFSSVAAFVTTTFTGATSSIGGAGSGQTLDGLICETIGFLVISLLLGFIGAIGYAAYQIGIQRQPVSTVLDPFFGFVIFAGASSAVIAVLVGTTAVG